MWNVKRVLFLVLAVFALAVYFIFSEFDAKQKAEQRIETKKILSLPEESSIVAINIGNKGKETIELLREGNQWWIRKPVRYPAEDFVIEGLAAALTATTTERSFEISEVNLDEMGLKNPAQKVHIVLSGKPQEPEKNLLIGREAPAGRYVYAMWENGRQVFMLHDQFARSFDKTLYSLRKKRIFDIPSEEIHAVDVALEGKKFILVKWKGKWRAVSDQSEDIDAAAVENFLSDLNSLYVREFLDQLNSTNPDLGLEPLKYAITITKLSGDAVTLRVGKRNKDKESFYGRKEDEQTVLLLAAERLESFPSKAAHFRKKPARKNLALNAVEQADKKKAEVSPVLNTGKS